MEHVQETWVQEAGLPHPCRRSADDLGQRVLIATDFSDASRRVQARAFDLAAESGAVVIVLAISSQPHGGDERLRTEIDEIEEEGHRRGVQVEAHLASGDPVDAILHQASDVEATGILVADDQWQGAMAHPCLCAPLIRRGAVPVMVMHSSATAACGRRL